MSCTYIVMGKTLELDLIQQVRNINYFCKPNGGLWASPYGEYGEYLSEWHEWCDGEEFMGYEGQECSLITLSKDARILRIDDEKDAEILVNYLQSDELTLGLLSNTSIDFEKLSIDYDAILLTSKGQAETRYRDKISLYGWDVESLLVIRKDCIENIESTNFDTLMANKKVCS